jgi:TPR repeat protein
MSYKKMHRAIVTANTTAMLLVTLGRLGLLHPDLDADKLLEGLRESAERMDKDALFILGNGYFFGHFGPPDHAKAVELFHAAAKKGNRNAFLSLAVCHMSGHGVPRDAAKARKYANTALARGLPDAGLVLQQLDLDEARRKSASDGIESRAE